MGIAELAMQLQRSVKITVVMSTKNNVSHYSRATSHLQCGRIQ